MLVELKPDWNSALMTKNAMNRNRRDNINFMVRLLISKNVHPTIYLPRQFIESIKKVVHVDFWQIITIRIFCLRQLAISKPSIFFFFFFFFFPVVPCTMQRCHITL